jgi:hypothetical protein
MSVRKKIFLFVAFLLVCAGYAGWKLLAPLPDNPANSPLLRIKQEQEVTPLDTPTDLPPTPTETFIPTLELPTPESHLPMLETWTAAPTGTDSQSGFFFRLEYDSTLWALSVDETNLPALIHRDIPYCQIIPTGGRGLPRGDWTVDSQFQAIGLIQYELVTVSQENVPQYVNYFGSDGIIVTGFQVSFQDQMNACLQAAETIFASLSSVVAPAPTATPTLEPTSTPEPTP